MSTKNSTKRSNGGIPGKTHAKRSSSAGRSISEKRESLVTVKDKRFVRRDETDRFVEAANEHMLRAWDSIHKNNERARKAN